jgi:hypothetical protein
MAKVKQQRVPSFVLPIFKAFGIKVKNFKSAKDLEKVLLKFIKRNNVLHLSTCKGTMPRTTPLEYRPDGLTFYILSEGGHKFNNLKANKNVSFSIAEPYFPKKDFWGAQGLQVWGKARVYSTKTDSRRFNLALKKMKVLQSLKQLGVTSLPPQFNYRIIEITPDRMTYGNVREGAYNVTWTRK